MNVTFQHYTVCLFGSRRATAIQKNWVNRDDLNEPAHSPVFCRDFLHDLNLEITLGDQLVQSRILRFELPQTTHVGRWKASEPPAPSVDRLFAGSVPLGQR